MKVAEIFQSIDGEINHWHQGRISTFVRFAQCNLDCSYCDAPNTKQINANHKEITVEEIIEEVKRLGCNKITITGGEPLIQPDILTLILRLYNLSYSISIETNGSIRIPFFKNVSWIIDYKLEYTDKMKKYNYPFLSKKDWIKIPVRNIEEIKQAIEVKNKLKELTNAQFAISPIIEEEAKKGEIKEFIDYLISIKEFDFVVNLQLHKFIDVR